MLSAPGADVCVFKTTILCDGVPVSTGHAEEIRGVGNVNKSAHVENCETSSLGRGLANFPMYNFAGSNVNDRASREEMAKVQRMSQSPATSNGPRMEQGTDKRMPDVTVTQPAKQQFDGTKTIPNKFKTKCSLCGVMMAAETGLAINDGSGWVNRHKDGECNPEEPF
jgi:hypothetical protein